MTEKLDTNICFAISCKFISVLLNFLKKQIKIQKKVGRIKSIDNLFLNSALELL
jgi:hypothetical protein